MYTHFAPPFCCVPPEDKTILMDRFANNLNPTTPNDGLSQNPPF